MSDRLEEIRGVHHSGGYRHNEDCRVCWLLAEVDRLRECQQLATKLIGLIARASEALR